MVTETTERTETGGDPGSPTGRPRWSGRTRGGYFGNWFFIQLVRGFGVWPAYLWVVFVAAYFTVAHRPSYRASADYLHRLLGPAPWWRRPWRVYRHFLASGVTLVDRLAVFMGRHQLQCTFDGEALFHPYLEQHRGIILLGAHVGCAELGGHFLGRFDVPVNLVVIDRERTSIQALLDSATRGKRFQLLTVDDNPLRSVPILAALRRGEIVALLGDRSFGGADVDATFLGGPVRLPVGPYRLAAASGAPLFQVFIVREKIGRYRFTAFPPDTVSREALRAHPESVRTYAQRYLDRIAAVVRQHPFQWANFYPYWGGPAPTGSSPDGQGPAVAAPHTGKPDAGLPS